MRFMVIVKASKDSEAGVMPTEQLLTEMGKYNEELVKAGVMLAGEGLQPSSKGARVRFEGKQRTVIDGPFSETKELVAGYWLWQVRSKDEAIEWLKRAPFTDNEEVELRQVFEMEDFGAEFTPELREQEKRLMDEIKKRSEATHQVNGDPKMKFMVIRKADPDTEAGVMPTEQLVTDMLKYNEEMIKAGVMLDGMGLQPSVKGARVKFSNGKPAVIDGPFTEAKELIAGFSLIQVKSREEAIEWVKRWPPIDGGGNVEIEIRQVYEAEDFGAEFTPEMRKHEEWLREAAEKRASSGH